MSEEIQGHKHEVPRWGRSHNHLCNTLILFLLCICASMSTTYYTAAWGNPPPYVLGGWTPYMYLRRGEYTRLYVIEVRESRPYELGVHPLCLLGESHHAILWRRSSPPNTTFKVSKILGGGGLNASLRSRIFNTRIKGIRKDIVLSLL